MGSSENLGTNSASSTNGGILPLSLLESATLSTGLDDNSALTSLQISLRTPSGSDPINTELERLEKAKNGIEDKNSNQDSTNYTPLSSNIFDSQTQNFINTPLLPTSSNNNSAKTKAKDSLTGNATDNSLVGITQQNLLNTAGLLGIVDNSQQNSSVQTNSSATPITSQTSIPNFAIRTEGTISINGNGDFDGVPTSLSDDALIYAAKGFIMNGNLTLPVQIDAAGNPIRDANGKLVLVDKAVAVASGYTTSIANGSSNKYAGLTPPPVVPQQTVIVPAYADIKQIELNRRIPVGTPTVTFNISQNPLNSSSDWSKKFPPPGTTNNPTVVRVTGGGLNIPANVSLNNYIITVEQGDINFNGNGHNFNNVVLIANNGNVNLSNLLSRDLSVFASGSINMNGGARFAGSSLLATGSANGNITFNGATSSINTTDNLKVFSQGDITYNGATNTRGLFLSVKNFIFNGNSSLYGSISAKGNIIFNGQATVIGVAELMPDINPPIISATLARDTAPFGQTNQDFITFDPTITGTVTDANPILEFRAGLNNTLSANYTNVMQGRNNDGSFSFTRSQLETINGGTLSDGVYTLHLQAKDLYGNLSNTFDLTFTLDTTTPDPNNLDLRAIDDSGSNNIDNITNKNTPSITGNAEAGAVVQLLNNGQTIGQATANNAGVWQIVTSPLTDGVYNLTAKANDIAGNVSNLSTAFNVTIDSTLPLLTLNTPVDTAPLTPGARLTGSVDGTGSAITALSYHFNNLTEITVPFDATGAFDQSLNLTGLANGAHTLTITATDTAGNIKTTQYHVTVIIDQEAPVISASLLHDTAPNGQTNSDRITFDPTITGTVIDASRVAEFKAGFDSTQAASFTNVTAFRNANGSFTFDRAALETIYGGILPDGFHTMHLQAVDEFHNTSNIFDFSFTFDSTTSEPIFNLNPVSDSGVAGDFHTKFDTVTLTGLAEANSTVVLEQTGAVTTSDNDGQFTFAHVSLATGENSFTARSTDIAGNQNTFLSNIYRFSPPTAINLTGNTVAENSFTGTVIGQLSSVDPDPDDTYTYILEDNADGRFRIVGNQLQVADGSLLNFESSTQHSVTVTSTDANGLSLTQVFAIAVTNVNEAPTFLTTPIVTANSASLYTYNIIAADSDAGDNLKITTDNLPSWLTLVDNFDGTAILRGTPVDFLSNINSKIHLSVTDASGLTAIQDFTIAPSLYEIEENNFTVFRSLPLLIPSTPSILSFRIAPQFDTTAVNSINDAIEVALVDANGNSLVHTVVGERDAFFNWTEGESTALGAGTSYDAVTHTVSLNLTGINPGTNAQLVFRLVNNDGDITTSVRITDFAFTNAPDGTQAPVQTDFPQQISQTTAPNFNLLTDVSSSIGTEYHRTSFNADTHLLYADIALRNIGSYSVDSPLIVAVNHISDPTVLVRNPDGFTSDGLPYYDFSKLVGDHFFDPNELTDQRSLVFYNPQGVQFTYDLTVLAQLNAAPVILTPANKEVIGGHHYSYDVDATDPNGDSLTYKLLVSPDGMTIDQTTGLISWNTAASNTGNQTVLVEVEDGRGGIVQQKYTLSVIDASPNRPPLFTSTPIVSANVNSFYTYQASAQDPDDNNLSFSLVNSPSGMAIDSTGKVTWMPKADSLGTVTVTIKVEDSLGGEATQQFAILTQAEAGNQAPVFTTEPVTLFNLAKTLVAAKGNVTPQIIDLDLPVGAVATKDITLTLPNDGASGADIVFAVDESGSMGDARAWIANMVLDLEAALKAAGIGPNRYAFIGYGPGVIYGTTSSPEELVNLYTINGKADQRLYFDLEPNATSGFSWSLLRPDGQILQSGTSDLEAILPADGTYFLLVQHPAVVGINAGYRFGVVKSETNTTALSLGSLIVGHLDTPGQKQAYTFSGSAGQKLYFDGISSSNSNLDVRLVSPSGVVILNNIDVNSNNGLFVLPEAGTYSLTVDGVSDVVGHYSFRLLENGLPLTLDNTAINSSLAAGQTAIYQLSGSAGQRLYLDSLRNASANWRLLGPGNQQLATTSLGSDLELTLPGDGNYWLVLENTTATAQDYSFAAGIAQSSSTALSLGNLVTGRIDTPGQQDAYTFNGNAEQKLYFDGISGNNNLDVRLVSPSGTVILNNIDVNSNNGLFVLPEAGTYTLVVDGVGNTVGDYSFQMLENGLALTLDNATVNGTLSAGQTTIYQFGGSIGQRLYLDSKKSVSGTWRVIGAANQQLGSTTSLSSDLELTLAGDGSYWLVLENTTASVVNYSFAAGILQPLTTFLTLGSLVTGRINAAGEQDTYTFNGSAGQRLYFDGISGNSNLDVRLVSPSGTVILNNIDVNSNNGSFVLLETGIYTLTIDGVTDTLGDYSFRLWDSGNALALNNTVINDRLAASETTIYQFSGSAGQRLFFDSLKSASGTWKLLGPGNQQLATNNLNTDFGLTLSGDGNYWLVLENTTTNLVDYSFTAQVSSDAPVIVSGFGALHSGTIAAGQQQTYTLSANAGSLVYFDSQDVDFDPVTVVLTDPSGSQVFSTSASTDQGVLTLSRTGTYSLTVRGNTASATGDYGFQMLNLSDGAALSLNTLVSGNLASKDAVGTYTFSGSTGQKLYFDGITGNSNIDVRLISPSGVLLLNNIDVNTNSGLLNLLETGTYSLLVLGNNPSSLSYSFQLLASGSTLKLDNTPINGTMGAGQTAIYQLNGSAGQRLYLDSKKSASANWRLLGTALQQLASTSLGSDLELTLPGDGNYWLVLENTTNNLVDYSFAAGIPQFNTDTLALGSLITNKISVPGQQDAYTFNSTVGQKLYFDGISGNSNLDLRLVSPSGTVILNNIDVNSNNGIFILPEAGTYSLTVDAVTDAVGDYSFRLLENGLALTLDNATVNGTLSAGQTTIYQFGGSIGQRLYLDSKKNASGTWRVLGPANQQLANTSLGSDLDLTLPGDGNYWLVLENTTATAQDYSFAAGIAQSSSTALSLGNLVTGRLGIPGQQHTYTFNGSAGQRLYFDGISGNSNLDVRLTSPSGTILLNNIDVNSNNGSFVLLEAGIYSLVVDGVGDVVGDYSFRLLENGSALTLNNTAINGALAAGQTAIYQLDGSAGQRLYLDSLKSASTNWRLLGSANQQLASTSLGSDLELTLPGDGNYWLVLENTTANTVDYSFAARIPQSTFTPLTLGSSVTSRISAVGEQDAYTFNGSAGQRLYFDGISGNSNLDVRLTSPSGTILLNNIDVNSNNGSFSLLETGTYTLTVDGVSDTIGDYNFRLWDIGTALALNNTPINGRLGALETAMYQLDGSAGQRLFFDSLRNASSTWRLLGPVNQQLATNNLNTDFGLTLSADGNYWLVLENTSTSVVDYSFAAQVSRDALVTVSGFGALYSGTIAPGQQKTYTLSANAGSLVYFDSQDVDFDPITVALTDPNGTQVFSTSASTDQGVLTLSRAGIYSLTVRGNTASATGDYGFQMLNLSDETTLSLNTLVSDSLAAKDAVKVYNFSGSGGQKLYFDGIAGNSSIDVRLISPSGAVLLNNIDVNANSGLLSLLETGTYSLLVLGNNPSSLSYSFQLLSDNTALVLNTPYSPEIQTFATPETIGSFVRGSLLSSGFEDGYEAIDTALKGLSFRQDAAANIILITDEDRDVWDAKLSFTNTLAALEAKNVRLNSVINASFVDGTNKQALGMTPSSSVYLANGSGGFISSSGGRYTTGFGTTKQDYVDLAWANGGSAWDINQFRGSGASQALNATSFTKAFIAANVSSISQQLSLSLIASDNNAPFNNLTGTLGGVTGGQTVSFTGQFTGNGLAQVYDLLLVRPDTGLVLGSVPVVVNGAYVYDAHAVDPDGDLLTYNLLKAPEGATIDARTGHIRWLPTQIGEYEFLVETNDGRGGSATQAYKLSVKELPNKAPTIGTNLPAVATAMQPISYMVSATDADANSLSYFVVNAPVGLTIDKNYGRIDWTPTSGQLGEHLIQVRVLDGRGGEVTSEIKLTVVADSTNLAPEFTSTEVTQVEIGQSYRYTVSATDPNHDPLAFKTTLLPEGMSFDVANRVLVWQPDATQLGDHTVVLRVEDGRGGFDLQAFQVKVSLPNTAPVITATPPENITAVVGRPYQYQIQAIDADGEILTYRLDTAPADMIINQTTGVINWTPTADSIGTQEVAVTAIDARGGKTTKTFNLSILANAPNNVPVITSTPRNKITLGQPYFYTVTASDANYDPLTYSLDTAPVGMTIDPQGRITWQPQPIQLGSNLVSIKVSDGQGGVITQAFNIDVVSSTIRTNNAPSITSTPNLVTNIERTYAYNLSGSDLDNDLLLWSLDAAPAGMVIDAQRGTLRWQPSSNQIGEHDIKVRLTDASGDFVGQQFTLTVTGTNIPSAIVSNPVTRAAQNQLYTYTVVATDPENDPLTFSLGRKPAGMTIDSNGTIRWTPQASQIGSQQVEVFARDAQGAVTTQTFTVEVGTTAINHAPSITSTPIYLAAVGSPYSYQVQASDPDTSDRLTYQLLSVPAGVTGITIDPSTGLLTWNNPVAGNYKIVVGAVDAAGLGAAQGFTLTARANNAPVIQSNPKLTATLGSTYAYDIIATDADGDRLSYSLDQTSRDLGMSLDTLGRLRWTPIAGNVGSHTVVITINDGNGGTGQQQYNLSVAADDVAPKVRLIANYDSVNLGESITFQARATDNTKVAGLQLLIDGTPVVLDSNGMVTFKPTTAGTITAKAIAKDTAGNVGEATFSVAVIDTSDVNAPTVSLNLSAIAGGLITAPVDIKGSISDDGSLDYYRLLVAPVAGGEFKEIAFVDNPTAIANGVLGKFDPSLLQNDSYILRLEVADNGGHISYADEIVDVAGELKLGNFRLSFTDLTVPVTGIPITLTRTYDSLTSGSTDDFGYGWRMEFRDTDLRTSLRTPSEDSQLVGYQNPFKDGTKVYITLPGGKREAFTFKAKQVEKIDGVSLLYFSKYFYQPEFVAEKGVTSTLTVESNFITKQQDADEFYGFQGNPYNPADPLFGGKYKLTTKEGVVYEIDAQTGDLLTVTDTNGNKLTYTDADITSSTGQKITFGRDAQGRIATVTDPAGKQIRYGYNAQGDLISVTDREGNTTRMEYDEQHKHYLDKIIDPLGRTGVKNEYGDDGRLKYLEDVNGQKVEMSYDPANLVQTIKDALGNSTTYEYDERGNIVTEVDALGGITRRTFDEDNNLLSETTPEGRTTRFTYDERGDKLSVTDPLGNTTKYTYNSLGQKISTVDSLGNVQTNTYDRQGNLLSFKSATGSVIKSNFDPSGRQVSLIGADGSVTEFNYDSSGNVINQIDASGNEIQYTYDANGKLLSEAKQVVVNGELETIITQWTYDLNGKVTSMTDPVGNTTRYEYDHSGNLSSIIDSMNRKTRYIYDGKGQLIESINADGTSTKQNYDVLGRKVADIDELDRITRFTYDTLGRLVETILPDNTPEDLADNPRQRTEYNYDGLITTEIDPRGNRTEYVYDLAGRVTLSRDALGNETTYTYNSRSVKLSETDALGRTTRFIFDEAGRQIKTIFADRTTISNTYNAVGLRDTATDQAGRTTHYEYNSLHRLVETILPDSTPDIITDNPRIRWEYDQLGRVTAQIDPSGLRTEYSYDEASRLVSIRDQRGEQTFTYDAVGNRISETDALGRTTQFIYNAMNHLVETRFPDGSKTRIIYDAVGNINTKTDELGRQTQFTYDAQNRLTGVIDALNQQTEYGYDLAGNLIRVKDANKNINSYEYDALNRRTTTILPLGQRSEMTYDAVGNLLTQKDFNGNTTRYEYNLLNRLVTKSFPDNTVVLYSYTPTGQVLTTTDSNGLTNYTYDTQDRLLSRTDQDGRTISYTYDIVGNRTSVTTPGGKTLYNYDQFHRLSQVIDLNGNSTQYTYDAVNNLTRTELPNGTSELKEYDLRNRLNFIEQRNSNGVIASYRYALDLAGNRTQIVEQNGRESSYNYDLLNRLIQEAITDPVFGNLTNSFTYDPVGNRLTQNSSTQGLTTYSYDANDRLLSETHDGVATSYSYDNNGNTLSRSNLTEQVSYQWDFENHLLAATTTTANGIKQVQYRYNTDGVKVATTVDGVETRYLVDTNLSFAQVLEEYSIDGEVQTSYVFGHDLISQKRGDTISYYHADALGSIRLITNTSGQVTDSYVYDAYGNILGSTGNTVNSYRYTGEQFDQNLGEYYLRARYYNPSTGRFTARDPFAGFLDEPLSLAKYPYVHGNPVNFTDPSGLFAGDGLTTIILQGILSAMPSISFTTALTLARVATPIFIGAALVATYALADAYLATDADEDDYNGLPIVFFTDGDLPMHRRHINFAQTGFGFTKPYYQAYHNGQPLPSSANPINSVLNYLGVDQDRGFLDEAVKKDRNQPTTRDRSERDNALIARALGIYPQYINGRPYYDIPLNSYARDEYPFSTTVEGGPSNWYNNLVSVDVVTATESRRQGELLKKFYKDPGVMLEPGTPLGIFGVLTSPVNNNNSGFIRRDGKKVFLNH